MLLWGRNATISLSSDPTLPSVPPSSLADRKSGREQGGALGWEKGRAG